MSICICIGGEREKGRERLLLFSIVFITKNNKVKVSFSSKQHGKFSQIILCYGSKKIKEPKPTIILRFTDLMKSNTWKHESKAIFQKCPR